MVIFKNYLLVAIYNSLVTNKTVSSYSSTHQLPYDSLGECPVVLGGCWGYVHYYLLQSKFLPFSKMLIVYKTNPNAS